LILSPFWPYFGKEIDLRPFQTAEIEIFIWLVFLLKLIFFFDDFHLLFLHKVTDMADALRTISFFAVGFLYAQFAHLLPAPLAYCHDILAVLDASHKKMENKLEYKIIGNCQKKGLNTRDVFYH